MHDLKNQYVGSVNNNIS